MFALSPPHLHLNCAGQPKYIRARQITTLIWHYGRAYRAIWNERTNYLALMGHMEGGIRPWQFFYKHSALTVDMILRPPITTKRKIFVTRVLAPVHITWVTVITSNLRFPIFSTYIIETRTKAYKRKIQKSLLYLAWQTSTNREEMLYCSCTCGSIMCK